MPTIGILHSGSKAAHQEQIAAFIQGLSEAGYTDGRNVTIAAPLWSDDDRQKLSDNAAALIRLPVDVLVAAGGSASAVAAKAATLAANPAHPVPVVFTTVADPVASGLVGSLDKPGHLTGTAGMTSELDVKRLELLHELWPDRRQIGVLTNSTRPQFARQDRKLQEAAESLGLQLVRQDATTPAAIDAAFNAFAASDVKPVLVTADPLFNSQRQRVIELARAKKIPAIYQWREFVAAGGLMSYGPSIDDAYKQAGIYVGRILDGKKPSELPVVQSTKFDLIINMDAARAVGITVPSALLARADEKMVGSWFRKLLAAFGL